MAERVFILHEGAYDDPRGWSSDWPGLAEGEAVRRKRVLAEGTFVRESDGVPLPPARARFARAEILGTYADMPRVYDSSQQGPVRAYIPGLMNHGTIPMLGGPPKVGKSSVANQLAASLIIPGRRFLNAFKPAQMTVAEAQRHVWLINGENPPDEEQKDLERTGLEYEPLIADAPYYSVPGVDRVLFVEHLDALGGADVFDMTSDEQREFWEYRILKSIRENGGQPPLTLIADGVTAMLNADTARYGRWFSGFKQLLRALDIPNGLAVGHSGLSTGHLMNGVESMAGPDGLWMYTANEPDKNPNAPRFFQTSPRLHGPRVDRAQVIEGDDGLLHLRTAGASGLPAPSRVGAERRAALVAKLHDAGAQGSATTPLTGDGTEGQANRSELERMQGEGLAVMRTINQGRTRTKRWWLTEFAPPA